MQTGKGPQYDVPNDDMDRKMRSGPQAIPDAKTSLISASSEIKRLLRAEKMLKEISSAGDHVIIW